MRLPNYVLYYLEHKSDRCNTNYFKIDQDLNTRTYESFTNTNFNRGHLLPAIDIKESCDTFTMANVSPQIACFNQKIWSNLEYDIRLKWKYHYILTVPEYSYSKFIFDSNNEKLYIPTGFYKIIFKNNKIVYNIYLIHDESICNKDFNIVGNFNKLPYFVY